jgi:L-alanine-DL-glutamate epimerase-like enolase superfamily enzyme
MKITDVECHVLLEHDFNVSATSSAQDGFIVEVHTDEGISGIGEADVNPWIGRACVEAPGTHTMGLGLREMLIGADPLDPRSLWERLYVGSAMNGRRGAVIHAIGAVDMALWDIAGKAAGVPTWQLLGEPARAAIVPYASLLPPAPSYAAFHETIIEWTVRAQALGFRAAKLELLYSGPYRHGALDEPDERMTETIAAVRAAVGPEMTLMVDVGYAWDDVDRAARTLRDWSGLNVFFVETPLRSDDMAGLARLHEADTGIRIAAGEWLSTRYEFHELLDHGKADVAQPDIGRVGGLTEAVRVAELAAARGKPIVPHLWKTGISVAAAVQLATVAADCPFIEFLPEQLTESALRRHLSIGTPALRPDGTIALPTKAGLGVELDRATLERFRIAEA